MGRRKTRASWFGAYAACLSLALCGCGGSGSSADSDGREAATRFLADLKAGHLVPAWQETTPEFKSLMGLESLRDYVKTHPGLRGEAAYVEAHEVDRNDQSMVEHTFRAETRVRGKAVTTTVKVLMTPGDDGSWDVEHLSVE